MEMKMPSGKTEFIESDIISISDIRRIFSIPYNESVTVVDKNGAVMDRKSHAFEGFCLERSPFEIKTERFAKHFIQNYEKFNLAKRTKRLHLQNISRKDKMQWTDFILNGIRTFKNAPRFAFHRRVI
jgi:hypothetical protein